MKKVFCLCANLPNVYSKALKIQFTINWSPLVTITTLTCLFDSTQLGCLWKSELDFKTEKKLVLFGKRLLSREMILS